MNMNEETLCQENYRKIVCERVKSHRHAYADKARHSPKCRRQQHKCYYCEQYGGKRYDSIIYTEKYPFCDGCLASVYSYTVYKYVRQQRVGIIKIKRTFCYAYYSPSCGTCLSTMKQRKGCERGIEINDEYLEKIGKRYQNDEYMKKIKEIDMHQNDEGGADKRKHDHKNKVNITENKNRSTNIYNFKKVPTDSAECHPGRISGRCFYCSQHKHVYRELDLIYTIQPNVCKGCQIPSIYKYWRESMNDYCYVYFLPSCKKCIHRKKQKNGSTEDIPGSISRGLVSNFMPVTIFDIISSYMINDTFPIPIDSHN